MRRATLIAVLLASPINGFAGGLKGFHGQFAGDKVVETTAAALDVLFRPENGDGFFFKAAAYTILAPYALSASIGHEGYAPLYQGEGGDIGQASHQHRFELSAHRPASYLHGWGGRWRLDTESHVGLEAFWADYIEHRVEDLHYLGATANGDFARGTAGRASYQLGMAALSGQVTRVGPRVGVEGELYPLKPFFLDALAAATFIDGGPLGELRAGAGVAWGRAQMRLSWKALIGPLRNLAGPELAFVVRL